MKAVAEFFPASFRDGSEREADDLGVIRGICIGVAVSLLLWGGIISLATLWRG
jgi:hypothetical protein